MKWKCPHTVLFLLLPLFLSKRSIAQEEGQEEGANITEPVQLQRAGLRRIRRDLGLDRLRAIRLLEYRREHGPIRSFYELHYLEGFSRPLVQRIREGAQLERPEPEPDSLSLKDLEGKFRIRWGRILQRRQGYKDGSYRGPPSSFMAQLQLEMPGIASIGGNLEKDAGEPWLDPDSKLPDAMGGYLELKERGIMERLVVGRMNTSSGGGLLLNDRGGFGQQGGPESGPLFTLDPNSGSPDRGGLNGIGGKFGLGNFKAALLYSKASWTARLDSFGEKGAMLRTLYRNGLHRRSPIARSKGAWERKDWIGHLGWRKEDHVLSTSFHHGKASHPDAPPRWIRDEFSTRRAEESGVELHYRGRKERAKWSLSLASDRKGHKAASASLSSRPYDDLWVWAELRGAESGFDPFWSPTARSGRPFISMQFGVDRRIAAGWLLKVQQQTLHRYWPYYQRDGPGTDRSLELELVHNGPEGERLSAEFGYRQRERDHDDGEPRSASSKEMEDLQSSFRWDQDLGSGLQSRLSLNAKHSFQEGEAPGYVLAHDLIRNWEKLGIKLYWRMAVFDAPNYATSSYLYENDVLYAFSVNPYYRQGWRSYVVLRAELSESLTLEGKIGSWAFRDPEGGSIGSGASAIEGRYRSRTRLQLRGSF